MTEWDVLKNVISSGITRIENRLVRVLTLFFAVNRTQGDFRRNRGVSIDRDGYANIFDIDMSGLTILDLNELYCSSNGRVAGKKRCSRIL